MNGTQNSFDAQRIIAKFPRALKQHLDRSSTLRRFLNLASWTMVSFALDKGTMIIIVLLLARILGAEDYGRLTLAQGLANTAQIFIILGAGSFLARHIPAMREQGVERAVQLINLSALVTIGTATIFTSIAIIGSRFVATAILNAPADSTLPYWITAWVILSAANALLMTIMLSFEKGRALGIVSLLAAALSIALIPLLAIQFEIYGAIAGMVLVEVCKNVILVVLYNSLLHQEGASAFARPKRSDAALLLSFGLPVFLQSALWAPTIWLAQLIVKTQAPNGLAAVGVFGFTNTILGAVILASSLTNRAALPILSSLKAKGDQTGMRKMSGMMALGQAALATAISLPFALGAPLIMSQIGPEFTSSWPVLIIMIATGIIIAGQTALGNYLLVEDRPYYLLITIIPWAALILGAAMIFPEYGAYALAWGLLLASAMRTLLFFIGFVHFSSGNISGKRV